MKDWTPEELLQHYREQHPEYPDPNTWEATIQLEDSRLGWTARVNSWGPGGLWGSLETPSFWRPTRMWALNAARRWVDRRFFEVTRDRERVRYIPRMNSEERSRE